METSTVGFVGKLSMYDSLTKISKPKCREKQKEGMKFAILSIHINQHECSFQVFDECISQGAFRRVHFAGYISQGAFHRVHFAGCISQGAFRRVHFAGYISQGAFRRVHFAGCISQGAFRRVHFAGCISQGAFRRVQSLYVVW